MHFINKLNVSYRALEMQQPKLQYDYHVGNHTCTSLHVKTMNSTDSVTLNVATTCTKKAPLTMNGNSMNLHCLGQDKDFLL